MREDPGARESIRRRASRFADLLVAIVFLTSSCAGEDPRPVTIDPVSHVLVLEPDASPSEIHAAETLQRYFKEATGGDLPLRKEGDLSTDGPMIVLGRGETARSLGVDPDPAELGEQGFVIATHAPHVVIAGTKEAGTLYGVHRFLEDYLGVRWYAPGVTKVPRLARIQVPPSHRLVRPAFLWRHTSYAWPGKDEDFLSRMADNGGSQGADSPYGIQHEHDGRAHSYFTYVSPEEFFDTHPEYFSEIGGVRIREETQLCLTNPDVLEIVTKRMLDRMANRPNARQHNFSQMDHYNYCQCPRCREMNERYGTAGGTQFWFVNQLAERTSQVYPEKLIGTLAYMYTEEPPKGLRMHPNVAVWLCHMYPSCDSHPIATCPLNADYKRRAETWSTICSHVYIWHYVVNFTHYYNPFPNFRALAADMRFYRSIGVEGIYQQGMGHAGGGGEFSLLRPYYGMKLLWDPDEDPESLRRDFLQGYYGAAWEPVRDYHEMLHEEVGKKNIHMHLYTNPAEGYLTDSVMARAEELFDRAEAAVADDAELLERVRVARMPLTYARIFPRNGYDIRDGRIAWRSEIASVREVVDFLERMERHDFRMVREAAGEPEYLALLYLLIKSEPKLIEISNRHLAVEVAPLLGGRTLRISDRQTGKSITAHNKKENLFFPFAGGLEDRVGEGFLVYGWVEPAIVTIRGSDSIAMTQTTVDGYRLEKTLRLDPEDPILHVRTVLTNPSSEARKTRLRSHLELALGELRKTRTVFVDRAGTPVEQATAEIIEGLREGKHFYDREAPRSSWVFSGTNGLEVTQRFDDGAIDSAWLYAYPETLGELEIELWTRSVLLGPGESIVLEQDLEVRSAGSSG